MKISKKELNNLIKEAIESTLKTEVDRGDHQIIQSRQADQVLVTLDQNLDSLKALAKALRSKDDPASIKLLNDINASLAPFVQKVTTAVRKRQ